MQKLNAHRTNFTRKSLYRADLFDTGQFTSPEIVKAAVKELECLLSGPAPKFERVFKEILEDESEHALILVLSGENPSQLFEKKIVLTSSSTR